MQITLDTANITDADRAILRLVLGTDIPAVAAAEPVAEPAAEAVAEPAAEAVAEPASAAPKRKRRTKAEIEADEAAAAGPATVVEPATADLDPEPVVAETVEATVVEEGGAPTLADAIAAATDLLASGKGAKVKAALDQVGASKVSQIAPDDIPAFLYALSA